MKRGVMLPMIALCACSAGAHPMGNFSVSHYSRIELTARGVTIRYVLDLAVNKESRSEQAGKIGFQGSVKLSDGKGRVLYSTAGDVQCSG